ncbi:bestrophin family protein [Brevifollis gellanilyticus]|uniref:Membrane protein n=1 Tax=Brevifollis gellanilyticus TaxID=748831 RepID=A0A512MBS1_9BACT|nr:bestrophin family ion channel [Brevifollis gellanilyticus]GEP44188.1 membrane protein [Brevifollis gellanilyticus]
MITYNPKDWWKLIFAFHRSDSFRVLLPGMIGLALYTALIAYIENDYLHVTFKNTTMVHSLVGFVLSMMLIFRTNTAYDRWWEGRKLWGSFVNNSRNLALKLQAFLPAEAREERAMFRDLIGNFIYAAKEHLRQGVKTEKLVETGSYTADWYAKGGHVPNQVLKGLYTEINRLYMNQTITGDHLIVINAELQSFADNLGACERIKRTPIPYAYSLFLKKIIFIYVFTMPIGFVLDYKYWAVPVVTFVFYAFAAIEVIAEEIEDPFGLEANDLPLDAITDTIRGNVRDILEG